MDSGDSIALVSLALLYFCCLYKTVAKHYIKFRSNFEQNDANNYTRLETETEGVDNEIDVIEENGYNNGVDQCCSEPVLYINYYIYFGMIMTVGHSSTAVLFIDFPLLLAVAVCRITMWLPTYIMCFAGKKTWMGPLGSARYYRNAYRHVALLLLFSSGVWLALFLQLCLADSAMGVLSDAPMTGVFFGLPFLEAMWMPALIIGTYRRKVQMRGRNFKLVEQQE